MLIADIPKFIVPIANFIVVFLYGFVPAIILWFVLKKVFKNRNIYKIAVVCCILALIIGYKASSNIVGYNLTMDYLTEINNQKIEATGQEITIQEENEYKRKLFQSEEFQRAKLISSVKISLIPSIFIVIALFLLSKKSKDKKHKTK